MTSGLDQLRDYVAKNGAPDLVTITIGGNDLDFAPTLTTCFLRGPVLCGDAISKLYNRVALDKEDFIARLTAAYKQVSEAAGANPDSSTGPKVIAVGCPLPGRRRPASPPEPKKG
jgi:lysophospholipase L1-like esterase